MSRDTILQLVLVMASTVHVSFSASRTGRQCYCVTSIRTV